jgi:hypothetical protein
MLDTRLQERFTRGCTEAAFGYTAATTAAYAAFADQVFGFWTQALQPPKSEPPAAKTLPFPMWTWPIPAPAAKPEPAPMPFTPFMPFAWMLPQKPAAPAPMADPFASANAAFAAWFNMFPLAPPSPAWPMAFMMMASGVPRSVAMPTAEANLAAMDAADAAAVSVRQAFSSYHTDTGHASTARQVWPPAQYMMLAAMVPLTLGPMLTSMRLG